MMNKMNPILMGNSAFPGMVRLRWQYNTTSQARRRTRALAAASLSGGAASRRTRPLVPGALEYQNTIKSRLLAKQRRQR
jgi:hypothetical protein